MKPAFVAMLVGVLATAFARADGRKVQTTINAGEQILAIVFSPDGKLLATGDANLGIKLWDVARGKEKATLSKPDMPRTVKDKDLGTVVRDTEGYSSLAFSPDGKLLAAASNKGKLIVWELPAGKERTAFRPHTAGVTGVAFSPDGKLLATSGNLSAIRNGFLSAYGEVKLWDATNFKEKAAVKLEGTMYALCVAFSGDAKLVAAGTQADDFDSAAVVELIDVATAKKRATLKGKGQYEIVNSIAFSSDNKLLAGGSGSVVDASAVRLWDVESAKEQVVFRDHRSMVRSVAFRPDGKLLASAADNTVKVWDLIAMKQSAEIMSDEVRISSVAFSPDGKLLAAAEFQTVRLYEAPVAGPAER
jgi:WD40 repeat protein